MSPLRGHEFAPNEVMAYLDGELEPRRASALAAHLDRCAECHELAKHLRQVSERMLDFQIEAAPEKLAVPVNEAVSRWRKSEGKHFNFQRPWWRFLLTTTYGWATACVVVIALVTSAIVIERNANQARALTRVSGLSYPGGIASYKTVQPRGQVRDPEGLDALVPQQPVVPPAAGETGVMIVRTASVVIVTTNYGDASQRLERLAASHGGYVQTLEAEAHVNSARSVRATMRVPADRLSAFLAALRTLGHVEQESQSNTEVTDEYVDLQARIKNAHATEQRLVELLQGRTGKLADVLDAERELARVRGEIEQMEGQRSVLQHRVDYASVEIQLREQYSEKLGSGSFGIHANIHNSLVQGFDNLMAGVMSLVIFLFAYGPSIVFWSLLILIPVWFARKKPRMGDRDKSAAQ